MLGFRLSSKTKDIEPHEIFIDKLAQKKEEELGASKRQFEVSVYSTNLKILFFAIGLCLIILLGRSFQLQYVEGEDYSLRAQRNIMSISQAQLLRGVIYDRDMVQLAYNLPRHDLVFRKKHSYATDLEDIEMIVRVVGKSPSEISEKITEATPGSVTIKRDLSHEEIVQLKTMLSEDTSFSIAGSAGRNYYYGDYFSHITGYIGKISREMLISNPEKYTIHDFVGKMGVERQYEEFLSRSGEKTLTTRDARGNIIGQEIIDEAERGKNIVLTVESKLQKIVVEKTQEKLEEINSNEASVIVLNPQTGEVLALFSSPTYDNNAFRDSGNQELLQQMLSDERAVFLNRVISASYPTGSVIKPLLAAAALEEDIITPEKKIHSPGYISIANPWNPSQPTIFRDFHVHGWRDMREAIAVSSNVYFYAIGGGYEAQEGLGVNRMHHYLSLFGWGNRTGIDLPGEVTGVVPNPIWKKEKIGEDWRIGDSYNLSIGQGYLEATPLQVANSFAVLVNGGNLMTPYVLRQVVDDDGNIIFNQQPRIIREGIISPDNLKVVKEGMKMATTIGTARSLQVLPISSGAKTGTAQTSRAGINNNWVTVFAPYDNPEIVITIIIENVKGVTPVATHLARDILLEYYTGNN